MIQGRKITTSLLDIGSNPTIQTTKLTKEWLDAIFNIDESYERYFRAQIYRYMRNNHLDKIKQLVLDTVIKTPKQVGTLREVISNNFPQYKELADIIIMLQ